MELYIRHTRAVGEEENTAGVDTDSLAPRDTDSIIKIQIENYICNYSYSMIKG